MAKINRIDWLSAAKISSFIYTTIGLVLGAFVTLAALAGAELSQGQQSAPSWINKSAVIIFPIFYAGIGFAAGAVSALLFNFAAKVMGGLKINMEKD